MAYIRNLSNPEKLYIVGNRNNIEVHQGSELKGVFEYEDFSRIIKQFLEEDIEVGEEIKSGNAFLLHDKVGSDFKYIIGINNKFEVEMWEVTWLTIVRNSNIKASWEE